MGDDTRAEKFRINHRINRGFGCRQVAVRGRKEGDPPRWISAPPAPNPAAAGGHTDDDGKVDRWVEAQKPIDAEDSKKMTYYSSNEHYSSMQEWPYFPFGFEGFPALDDNPFLEKTTCRFYAI